MKKIFTLALLLCMATFVSAQNRSTLIHFKNGKVVEYNCDEIDSINFSDAVTYDLDIVATNTHSSYYGPASTGAGQYQIHLSEAPISDKGLPTQVDQTIVRIYALGEASSDSHNAKVPSGRYTPSNTFEVGTLYNGDNWFCLIVCTGINEDGTPEGYQVPFEDAVANIEYHSNGTYDVEVKGTLREVTGVTIRTVRFKYSGPMPFVNKDPSSYEMLQNDITMIPTGASGGYNNVEGRYGSYQISFYNCELDDQGFNIGAGELLNIAFLTEEGTPMDVSKLAGDYTPTEAFEGPWEPGRYMKGVAYPGYNIPIGTYYITFDENGEQTRTVGYVHAGTFNIAVDGENITYTCNFVTENGKAITMTYTGTASEIIDQSVSGAKPFGVKSKPATVNGLPAATRATAANETAPTLNFIKR